MDANRLDALARSLAVSTPRRLALRLLSAGLLGALLPGRAATAQRQDSDGDGLPDDDEVIQHGTDPNLSDTDGDNVSDGAEVAAGTNPRVSDPPPVPPPTCTAAGGACSSNTCCQPDPNYTYVQCCFDANGAGTCTDVAALGTFLCPDPGVPDTGCAVGLTNCGGFCTDLSTDHGNCGACGQRCSQLGPDYNCRSGACTRTCPDGLTDCFGRCVDLLTDALNCGGCGDQCAIAVDDEPVGCNLGRCTIIGGLV